MKEDSYSKAAKVLFYGTLDESYALKKSKHLMFEAQSYEQLLKLHQIIIKKDSVSNQVNIQKMDSHEGHFTLPVNTSLEHWREFKFNASKEIFYPVLYKWIGGFSDEDISKLLKLSLGSLSMRYNSGLIKLGSYLVKGLQL